jgi:hypothetical protein
MAKRELSNQAAAAKQIRATLKQAFPGVTFKVTSDSFSGGDSVDIRWTNGPTTAQVDALTRQHQYGHFDGMIDLYEYSNTRQDIPQAKYVQTQRDYSIEARIAAIEHVNARFGWNLRYTIKHEPAWRTMPAHDWLEIDQESNLPRGNGSGWQDSEVNSTLHTTSLLCPYCTAATLPGDIYCPQCGRPLAALEAVA